MSSNAVTWARAQIVGDGTAKAVLKEYAHWASEDYSSWVSNPTLIEVLELNIKTIRAARDRLVELGFLIETKKRAGGTGNIVVYQMLAPEGASMVQALDRRTGEPISLSPPSLDEYKSKQDQKRSPSKSGTPKGHQKRSPSKNGAPPDLDQRGTKNALQGVPDFPQGVPNLDPDFSDLGFEFSELGETRASEVDNADKTSHTLNENPIPQSSGFERFWSAWPAASGRKQARDVCLSHWIAKGLETDAELIVMHVEAMKRTQHWKTGGDPTPIRYLEGRRWRDCSPEEVAAAGQEAGKDANDGNGEWHLSDSSIGEQGKRVRVERRPNESTPEYLIRVAAASGRGPWIEAALRRARGIGDAFYRQVYAHFSELDLLSPDQCVTS
ncbi:hypothetical protein AB3X91_11865 [Paraburkholderia sp. BR14263]|uniref:hypothetical protein n=1 Tax=unclassified Paraburkholderia TaxID=2615204 RepID=UPI0034CFF012